MAEIYIGPDRLELSKGQRAVLLALVSFLALYLELFLIRWIPGCLKVIGYYTNLVLISSFLGLGLGMASSKESGSEKNLMALSLRLLVSLAVYSLIHYIGLWPLPPSWGERIWLNVSGFFPSFLAPEIVFTLNAWTFLPAGRELGRAFREFKPLAAYSMNLGGSIAGVLAVALLGALGVSPLFWMASGLAVVAAIVVINRVPPKKAIAIAALWLAGASAMYPPAREAIWSPYYKITVQDAREFFENHDIDPAWAESLGFTRLAVNDDYFQFAANLDPVMVGAASGSLPLGADFFRGIADYTNLPYSLRPPGRVLILGSGLGNDVAAALRSGSVSVDAVEIDPTILKLGMERHPEVPYQDRRVTMHHTDARRFLKSGGGPYDTIVFAFLDSHTLLSAHSSIRLDTFVYTRESFESAARLLSPDGVIVVMFATSRDYVGRRLYYLVDESVPGRARSWNWDGGKFGHNFDIVAGGPGLDKYRAELPPRFVEITDEYRSARPRNLPTDNWPFLYLEKRSVGWLYAATMAAIMAIAGVFTWRVVPEARTVRPHFFLLGAGFLLLETKSITEVSLLYGATWFVNAGVITAFLSMAILANLWVARLPLPREGILYGLLGATLVVAFLAPARAFLGGHPTLAMLGGTALVALPVLFSGLIFATSLRREPDPALALGSNILGAVAGGLLEYASLVAGFKALYIVAAGLYVAAYLTRKKR